MKITFGFSRAKNAFKLGSKVIQDVEKRAFSHAYIKYADPITKIILVSQASHGFVNITNYDIFLEANIVVVEYEYECSEEQFINVLRYIYTHSGKPYSKFQLLLIAIKKILHFEVNIRNGNKAFICSEWGGNVAKILGLNVPDQLDYETPSDLEMIVRN